MNVVTINLEALNHNIRVIDSWMRGHGASWTVVTKVLCGHTDSLRALQKLGVRSMGDSRLANLKAIERLVPDFEAWYLRLPHLTAVKDIVTLANVSLNSEISSIEALNDEARRQDKQHNIIVMIELGDLREGILPGSLVSFYNHVFNLSNINVLGIGANLGCLSGSVPSVDQLMQLVLYRELLELKFERRLQMISGGSSVILPMLLENQVPKEMNHFRIGEAIFLGTNLITGGMLPELRDDVFTLEAEIAEIKEKSLVPAGDTSSVAPFESVASEEFSPGQRGYRAVLTLGQLDTDIAGLTPVIPTYSVAGASSDLVVVNVGENENNLKVGDSVSFRMNYAALLRVMSGKYIEKIVTPSIMEFSETIADTTTSDFQPVIDPDLTTEAAYE